MPPGARRYSWSWSRACHPLINYPHPYPPGSWQSGSNCRVFKDLPQGMLSDPGMRRLQPFESCWLVLWVSCGSGSTRVFCYHLSGPWLPQKWQETLLPGSTGVGGAQWEPGLLVSGSTSPMDWGIKKWLSSLNLPLPLHPCQMRVTSLSHWLLQRRPHYTPGSLLRVGGAEMSVAGGLTALREPTVWKRRLALIHWQSGKRCERKVWGQWEYVTGLLSSLQGQGDFPEEGRFQAVDLKMSRRQRWRGREDCRSSKHGRYEAPSGRKGHTEGSWNVGEHECECTEDPIK